MTDIILPRLNQTGTNEWADVESNDVAIRDVVNGELDNGNLSGSAGITDANLASPNNSTYKLLLSTVTPIGLDINAGTYILGLGSSSHLGGGGKPIASGGSIIDNEEVAVPALTYFDNADYEVGGKTQKLRLRAQALTNPTKPALKFTVGMYPITLTGEADTLKMTLGSVVTGSTVEINEPAASTATSAVGSDFAIPSDGTYALGVVTSAKLTNGATLLLSAQLQTRNV